MTSAGAPPRGGASRKPGGGAVKKPKTLKDPVFGTLSWGKYESWESPRAVRRSRRRIALEVEAESRHQPPTDKQREAYRRLLERESDLLCEIERALVKYYHFVMPTYRQGQDEDWVRWNMPDLKQPKDIWRLVELTRIGIPAQPGRGTLISLYAESTWTSSTAWKSRSATRR